MTAAGLVRSTRAQAGALPGYGASRTSKAVSIEVANYACSSLLVCDALVERRQGAMLWSRKGSRCLLPNIKS